MYSLGIPLEMKGYASDKSKSKPQGEKPDSSGAKSGKQKDNNGGDSASARPVGQQAGLFKIEDKPGGNEKRQKPSSPGDGEKSGENS